jgi:hypothetical protein
VSSSSGHKRELLTCKGLLSRLERINISEWLSHRPSCALSFDLSELVTSSLAKPNLQDKASHDVIPVGSLLQGVETTCTLLRLRGTSVFGRSTLSETAMRRWLTSALHQNQRLWTFLIVLVDSYTNADHQLVNLIKVFFRSLQDFVLHFSQPRWQSSVSQKIYSLWAECLAEIIDISQTKSWTTMTETIISVLDSTVELSSCAPRLLSAVFESLQPILSTVMNEGAEMPMVDRRIQVSHFNH